MPIIVNGTTLTDLMVGGTNITKVQVRQNEDSPYVIVFGGGEEIMAIVYAGNWKMNKVKADIDSFFTTFNANLNQDANKEVIIFPPACYLDYVKTKINASPRSSMLKLGIQNIARETSGAYTGQISAQQAADCGCDYVMVGNSEVRQYLGITNDDCNAHIAQALANNMKVIYCIGENLSEQEAEQSETVLNAQLSAVAGQFSNSSTGDRLIEKNILIAYEPVWSIGTGKTCSSDTAAARSVLIRNIIETLCDLESAERTTVLYGGSLKPANVAEYFAKTRNNGGLFGGVSLQGAAFANTINVDVS